MDSRRSAILQDLQTPDEATLAFNSFGFGDRLEPKDAAEFQAASIARAVLADNVPDDVRDNFERARKLHLYGVLDYEFSTAAGDYALLVLEGALLTWARRERLLSGTRAKIIEGILSGRRNHAAHPVGLCGYRSSRSQMCRHAGAVYPLVKQACRRS